MSNENSKPSITAIIPAGGSGRRMRSQNPKQFLTINDEPILAITLKKLASTGLISKFVIPAVDVVFARKIVKAACPELDVEIIKGGKTRQESVHNGLNVIKESAEQPDLVLVHDAVRALVSESIITSVVNKAIETGSAISAIPVIDTLKLSHTNDKGEILIKKNVSRDYIWQAQTPQVFRTPIIIRAYDKAKEDHFTGTDSASLVERLNIEVSLVEGSKSNFKITTPEDLDLAKILLA